MAATRGAGATQGAQLLLLPLPPLLLLLLFLLELMPRA